MSILLDYLNGVAKMMKGAPGYGEAYYRWIIKTGKLFTEREDVKKFQPTFKKMFKGCYYNAQFMSIEYERLRYYEGWGVTEAIGIPIEHGFNVINGKVIDISWEDGVEYFGIELPLKFVREEMLREKIACTLLFRWWEKNVKEVSNG